MQLSVLFYISLLFLLVRVALSYAYFGFSVSLPPFMSHRGLASSTMYTIQRLSPPFSHLMLQKSLRQVSRVIRQTRLCRLAVFRVTPIVFAHNPSSFGYTPLVSSESKDRRALAGEAEGDAYCVAN